MPVPRIYHTEAIVLSRFELGEADRVLTLLTPHDGKLKAIAKGVRRPGDAYIVLGGVELELDNRNAAIAAYREAAKYPETENNARTWLKSAGVK